MEIEIAEIAHPGCVKSSSARCFNCKCKFYQNGESETETGHFLALWLSQCFALVRIRSGNQSSKGHLISHYATSSKSSCI